MRGGLSKGVRIALRAAEAERDRLGATIGEFRRLLRRLDNPGHRIPRGRSRPKRRTRKSKR